MGIFLLSMFPFVSADNEIQLGQTFHLTQNTRVVLNDINPENGERLRLILISEDITLPAGISIGWTLNFMEDNVAIGTLPSRHVGRDTLNVNGMYEINIINVNWDEAESRKFSEVRIERFEEDREGEDEGVEEGHRREREDIIPRESKKNYVSQRVEAKNPRVIEKQEALNEVVSKLKDYIKTTKQKVKTSESISESEKAIFIDDLNEKEESIKNYISQIGNIKNLEEIESIKTNLKKEIKEIKPIVEKPTIKMHKDKISKIIGKLGILSKKLEKITSSLDVEDKSKVKELNNLIESTNKNIDKAQKLTKRDIKDTTEIKFLLKQATKDIKEAFSLVREILSDMEKDILYGNLETETREAEEIPTRKEIKYRVSKENNENYIENTYIELDETFELYEGQSVKLIDETTGEKKSVIITLKNRDDESVAINVNYWEWSDRISNKYDTFEEDEEMFIGPYTIKILNTSDNIEVAKFRVERN